MIAAFRVDASYKMGIGHVMRCLTLADELKKQGAEIKFISREHDGHMKDLVQQRGYAVVILPRSENLVELEPDDPVYALWLGAPWQQDAEDTIKAISNYPIDWLIVDHYGIDYRWHKALRKSTKNILVIDDLADRQLDCDLLLDQTFGRKREDYQPLVPKYCYLLLGAYYSLLRSEFANLRLQAVEKRRIFNGINNILISIGGMDSDNVTSYILGELDQIRWNEAPSIDVVLADNAPHLQTVLAQSKSHSLKVRVHLGTSSMAELMLKADLSIGSGGTTSWERCCLGLPTLIIVTADNQKEVVKMLSDSGAVQVLGESNQLKNIKLKKYIEKLLTSPYTWSKMCKQSFKVTNGKGVLWMAAELAPPLAKDKKVIHLRPVTAQDIEMLYAWQSLPETRRFAHNPETPTLDEHSEWVSKRLNDSELYTGVIMHGNEPSGVISLDPVKNDDYKAYLISIYITPDKYRLGLAKGALTIVLKIFNDAKFIAEVHKENSASHALFKNAGFEWRDGTGYVKSM